MFKKTELFMFKKLLSFFVFSSLVIMPVCAADTIFTSSDSEDFSLQPLNYGSSSQVPKSAPTNEINVPKLKAVAADNELSNKNYTSAISNLNSAQVELREQMASYTALMSQAKTNYESRKEEYREYKRQYNAIKKKMNNIEKTKKLIQNNITPAVAN